MSWETGVDLCAPQCANRYPKEPAVTAQEAQLSALRQPARGREDVDVYIQLIHLIVQQKLARYCKATIPQ